MPRSWPPATSTPRTGWLCAGAVRDAVWNDLHQRAPAPPRDIDLAFFGASEADIQARLQERAPEIRWDARDQARMHEWYLDRFDSASMTPA